MTISSKTASLTTTTTTSSTVSFVLNGLISVVLFQILYRILLEAYDIRLYAIKEFGRIIHEFDPYFNYRATEVSNCSFHIYRIQMNINQSINQSINQ